MATSADPVSTEQPTEQPATAAAESSTSTSAPASESKEENVMPPSSIEAANQALTSALEAANISKDDDTADVLAPGEETGAVKTVFHNATQFNVKHPLYSPWTLWYESPQTKNLPKAAPPAGGAPSHGGGWMDNVRPVVAFNSVEEFWGLYNNIVPPSQLPPKANYYLFKESIIPAWEDDANKDGGKWSIQMPREKNRPVIDQLWLNTMLAAIGETFETPLAVADPSLPSGPPPTADLITGVIFSTRPNFYRIAIWTRASPGPEAEAATDELLKRITLVGRNFKTAVMGYEEGKPLVVGSGGFQTEVEFINHRDSEKKDKKSIRKIVV